MIQRHPIAKPLPVLTLTLLSVLSSTLDDLQVESQGAPDERQLIERARQLDDSAWRTIFAQNYRRLFGILYYRVGDPDTAEELVSQVFEQAVRNIHRFDDRGIALSAWLSRIAQNLAVDYHRRRKSRPPESLELNEAWASRTADPARQLLHNERLRYLALALDRLTAEQRDVILLRFVGQFSTPEVGASLGKSSGAVKALQHRALATLRRELEALGYDGIS